MRSAIASGEPPSSSGRLAPISPTPTSRWSVSSAVPVTTMPSSRSARAAPSKVAATPGKWTDSTSHRSGVQSLGNRPEVRRTRWSIWSRAARLTSVLAMEIGLKTRARATDFTPASSSARRTVLSRRAADSPLRFR